jgi:hypothetical protein
MGWSLPSSAVVIELVIKYELRIALAIVVASLGAITYERRLSPTLAILGILLLICVPASQIIMIHWTGIPGATPGIALLLSAVLVYAGQASRPPRSHSRPVAGQLLPEST